MISPRHRESLNPYHLWLGIPASEQPANHYRLLGLDPLEDDADVIDSACECRLRYMRRFLHGRWSDVARRLCNELSHARNVLLDPERKRRYDRQLARESLGSPERRRRWRGAPRDLPRTVSQPPSAGASFASGNSAAAAPARAKPAPPRVPRTADLAAQFPPHARWITLLRRGVTCWGAAVSGMLVTLLLIILLAQVELGPGGDPPRGFPFEQSPGAGEVGEDSARV